MSKLGRHLAAGLDPVVLAERVGMVPDDWQAEVLRSQARRRLLICGRQVGKTETAAVLVAHTVIYYPGSTVLITAPSQRQAQRLFRRALALYRSVGRPVPSEAENALSLELENGSELHALPGDEKTIRGFSAVKLLVLDEAARIPDDFMAAVEPMVAVGGGRMLAASSPFGRRGWFYEASLDPTWEKTTVPSTNCPRWSKADLESYRLTRGSYRYNQELLCQFTDAEGQVFSTDIIDRIFDESMGHSPMAQLPDPVQVETNPSIVSMHSEVAKRNRKRLLNARRQDHWLQRHQHRYGPMFDDGTGQCIDCGRSSATEFSV